MNPKQIITQSIRFRRDCLRSHKNKVSHQKQPSKEASRLIFRNSISRILRLSFWDRLSILEHHLGQNSIDDKMIAEYYQCGATNTHHLKSKMLRVHNHRY